MPLPGTNTAGHTLAELLVALAILGVLAGLALPSFAALRAEWTLRMASRNVLAGLAEARMAALSRSTQAGLCPSDDARHCARGGAQGFIVYTGDSAMPQVLRALPLPAVVELRANRPAAVYYAWPRAASPVTLTLCTLAGKNLSRRVIVSQGGRPRVERAGPC